MDDKHSWEDSVFYPEPVQTPIEQPDTVIQPIQQETPIRKTPARKLFPDENDLLLEKQEALKAQKEQSVFETVTPSPFFDQTEDVTSAWYTPQEPVAASTEETLTEEKPFGAFSFRTPIPDAEKPFEQYFEPQTEAYTAPQEPFVAQTDSFWQRDTFQEPDTMEQPVAFMQPEYAYDVQEPLPYSSYSQEESIDDEDETEQVLRNARAALSDAKGESYSEPKESFEQEPYVQQQRQEPEWFYRAVQEAEDEENDDTFPVKGLMVAAGACATILLGLRFLFKKGK